MELLKFTQCTNELGFNPIQELDPALTPTAYEGQLLNGFNHNKSSLVLNYHKEDCLPIVLFKSLYKELSYIEILNLHCSLNQNPRFLIQSQIEDYYSIFGLKLDENLKQINTLVLKLPPSFLNWCAQKKWGPQDFAPIKSFPNGIPELSPYLEKINNPITKNEGTQLFELLIELLMLGKNLEFLHQQDLLHWLHQLKKERYPMTTLQSKKNEAILQKLSWPLHSQPKWIRRGDKSGVELKIFFSHPQELERSLIMLEQVKTQLQKNNIGETLWSID